MSEKKNIKYFFISISIILIPLIPNLLYQATFFQNFLINLKLNNIEIAQIKDFLIVLSVIFIIFPLGFSLYKNKVNYYESMSQRDHLFNYIKDTIELTLEALIEKENSKHININIRLFIPKKSIKNVFSKRKEFIIKNISGFSNADNTDGLFFEVYPNCQGILGQCYNRNYVCYDEDTSKNDYNLTEYQKEKTLGTKFCMCCPIHNMKDEICAMLSIDSMEVIHIDKTKDDWIRSLTFLSRTITDKMPHLCK